MINAEKIIAVVCPDSAPIKRMVQRAKEGAGHGERQHGVIGADAGDPGRESGCVPGDGKRGMTEGIHGEKRTSDCSFRFCGFRKGNADETADRGLR